MKFAKYGSATILGLIIAGCGGGDSSSESPNQLSNASVCYNDDLSADSAQFTLDYSIRSQFAEDGEELQDLNTLEPSTYGFRVQNGTKTTFGSSSDATEISVYAREEDSTGALVEVADRDPDIEYVKFDNDNKSSTYLGYQERSSSSVFEVFFLPTGIEDRFDLDTNEEFTQDTITERAFSNGEQLDGDGTIDQTTVFLGIENIEVDGRNYQVCKIERKRTTTFPSLSSESTFVSYIGVGNGLTLKSTTDTRYDDGDSYRSIREVISASINGKSI
ncbi:hypothetical protein [Enterovibrio baiacu]|uniref:hypothetical protein n=1 Tax=Enterovibrio baiacu TaxID=2491023 RepID=UPI003D0A985B